MYPRKFDTNKLSTEDKAIIQAYRDRRKFFEELIRSEKKSMFTCPGCGYPTLHYSLDEICIVCDWEKDYQDDDREDEILGGPNGFLSLTENRLTIGRKLLELSIIHNINQSEDVRGIFLYFKTMATETKRFRESLSENYTELSGQDRENIRLQKESLLKTLLTYYL